ncbi:MAG TPA: ABC transporter permease, partial [Candidatus Sulfotelmatobacter sp.]|nr:ABC transporter permease [Candidatus Sulfotelmatobacter sp.]
ARIDWGLAVVCTVGGLSAVVALGILMAAVCLQTRQESWSYPEAVAGALFLLVGAVFPLSVLPLPVQGVSLALPLTWWMAGFRQAVFPATLTSVGGDGSLYKALTGATAPDSATIVLALLGTTVLVTLVAAVLFRLSVGRAKDRGLIDRTTGS